LDVILTAFRDGLLMAWEVWWALVLGFAISAFVQAWVPRERIESALSGTGARPLALATGLGAASSSCSYAAIAIAKSLFQKGASLATVLAFQFASTNLVWELGLVLWILMGWQFTLAEFVGGIVMILLMAWLLRRFVSRDVEESARAQALAVTAEHHHHHHYEMRDAYAMTLRRRITSRNAWFEVAENFRADWKMLWKEITIGFLLAGLVAQLGDGFFSGLFITDAPPILVAAENAIVGPLIAILSFVCSVGNVPLAAVLWSGGISFGGVMAFIYADLIVLPIVIAYRKYYGIAAALRITVLMFITMVLAALTTEVLFGGLGLIPTGARPTRAEVFGSVELDYKFALNLIGLIVFTVFIGMTISRPRRGPGGQAAAG
jgi:uncharacterized membrane protein YraQ (UPF0718 family)